MDRYLLFFLSVLSTWSLLGQNATISGRVLDEDTQEGIPFCNVYYKGTTIGVSTDFDGYFILISETPGDTLVASALSYSNKEKPVASSIDQTINFSLGATDFTLSEVTVIAGENPANKIVRNIIKFKENNRIEAQKSYQCQSYSKLELDLINLSDEMINRKVFEPFKFAFENIDSISDEKPYIPAYIHESISDIYYVKSEGKVIAVSEADKVSGLNNKTVMEFIGSMHYPYSVYDNWIEVVEKPFVSPFSNQGLFYYEYYIVDSATVDNTWSYKLKFKPKRKQEKTFYGYFWVADSSFAIERVNMRMSEDANINLLDRVIIFEEFSLVENKFWLPTKKKMILDFKVTGKSPGVIGRKTVSFRDYRLGHELPYNDLIEAESKNHLLEDTAKDEAYWDEARHEKLTETEASVYIIVDSIKNIPIIKTYADVMFLLFSGYKEVGQFEIGPYWYIYDNNPVEGARFRLGAWTGNSFSDKIRFGGYLAYGLKDKKLKYGVDFQYNIRKFPRTIIGGSYKDDVAYSNMNSEALGSGTGFSNVLRRPILQKMLKIEEGKLFYESYWGKGWSNRVTILHQNMDPFGHIQENGAGFNYAYLRDPEQPTQIDTTISTTEFIFKTRYALGEKFLDGKFARTSLGTKHPIIELQYTAAIKGLLDADYTYHKIDFSFRHYLNIAPIGWLSYRIKAGKVFGQVPFLLARVHQGNETYFHDNYVFNGINNYEFASDTYVSLILVHHFDGFFFNKIPLLKKLKWRSVLSFRSIYGTMSEENKQANQLNSFDTADLDTYTGFQVPDKEPYMEVGAGVENIFKIFRFDVLWRLNYLNNPEAQKLTFRGGLEFHF